MPPTAIPLRFLFRPRRLASQVLPLVALLALHGLRADAATRTWTGAAGNGLWSDAGNWSGGVPVNGDTIVYSTTGGGNSFGNLTLSLASFRYAPAILPEHNFHLTAGNSLILTGFGIDNVSRFSSPSGVIRQQLFMDAGSTLTFQNTATVGGSDGVFSLPVDLNALGGTTAGGAGGKIVFEDNSSASGPPANTFTGLRVLGGKVAGAQGGELRFRESATMGFTGAFAALSGEVAGAAGGTVIFEGNAIASSGSNSILTGTGLGGRVIVRENAQATGSFNNYGAVTLDAGNEAVTQFLDDSRLDGFGQTFGGQGLGAQGGRVEFRQRAVFGGTNGGFIINGGGYAGGEGGRTIFFDDTRIVGTGATISNRTENEGINPGSIGGVTEFRGNSRAGSVTIYQEGASAAAAGTIGPRTLFRDNSSAENATIFAGGGIDEANAMGSSVEFSGTSHAANAAITAQSGGPASSGTGSGLGGRIVFSETASGDTANLALEPGAVFDMSALTTAGTTLGSIAGAGRFFLGSKSLTVGSAGLSTLVDGVIADGGTGGGTGAALAKVGAGSLELAGVNTYTGATAVNAGTLLVTGALANGAVSVASGATLGGTGTIGGAVTVADGGIVAPGKAGAGTLTVGALTLDAGSILNYQLGSASDRIDVNGALTLDGTVNVAALSGLTAGVYRLLNYTGAFTDHALALGTVPAGTTASDFAIQTGVAGQVNLVLNGGAGELLFWDGSNFASNGVINGGTSTWTNAPTNWTNSAGTVNQAWGSKKAVFSGVAGTVTLGENVTTTGLQFVTTGYAVNAGAGQSITLSGTAVVRVDALASATINAALTGGALHKDGDGTLVLTASNSYAGGTTLINGTLVVRNTAGLGLGTGPVAVRASPTTTLSFENTASVGAITITNDGAGTAGAPGFIRLVNTARAATATIINRGNAAAGGDGAILFFGNGALAENATLENLGAGFAASTLPGFELAAGGQTLFGDSSSAGAATITNRGGQGPGLLGGRTRFAGSSSAAQSTLTVQGGSNGGLGGTILFLGSATGGTPRVIFTPGGEANGLLDISGSSFTNLALGSIEGSGLIALGGKRLEVGGRNVDTTFSGAIDGFGGSLRKVGTADLTLAGPGSYTGGTLVDNGDLNADVTGALGTGAVFVNQPGRLFFRNAASAEFLTITNATTPTVIGGGFTVFAGNSTAGNATITNRANTNVGFFGGQLQFNGSASAGSATIINEAASVDGGFGGAGSGFIAFFGNATGGNATITNRGGGAAGDGAFAATNFFQNSKAGSATLINEGGLVAGSIGGFTAFASATSAETATLRNLGGQTANARGGLTAFESATAASASILNAGASVAGALGGVTEFRTGSTAGGATVRNTRATASGGSGGQTKFLGTSNAGTSAITNEGSQTGVGSYGFTEFYDTATAQAATVQNEATLTSATFGGRAVFYQSSTAGTALFDNEGAKVAGGRGGEVVFFNTASAEASTILNRGGTASGAIQGSIAYFVDSSKAGTATITNEGSAFAPSGAITNGGYTLFAGSSSAEQAAITNRASLSAAGSVGITEFSGTSSTIFSTADRATITNNGANVAGGFGGSTTFLANATAGVAVLVNKGGIGDSGPAVTGGGIVRFQSNATAGSATLTNEAGLPAAGNPSRNSGGLIEFSGTSTAAQSTINNLGGTRGVAGGRIVFQGTSTAGTAAIRNDGGISTQENVGEANLNFSDSASAGGATIRNVGGTLATSEGGGTLFSASARAGTATLIAEGATIAGGLGGYVFFDGMSLAEAATLRAESGTNGGAGGRIVFTGSSSGGTAWVILAAGAGGDAGVLDISTASGAGTAIGSLEGGGLVDLGSRRLTVGGNGLSTEFSGSLRDGGLSGAVGGSLTKTGAGTLKLSGTNTFTGTTTVLAGKLVVSGSLTGAVDVQGGVLGGNGMFNGGIVVGPGGVVAPGESIGVLTTSGALSFGTGSVFGLEIDGGAGTADRASALNITIGTGVTVNGQLIGSGAPTVGQQFTIVDNRSAAPIGGTFNNLPNGGTLDLGAARFAISYFGGDGNDVTLTTLIPEPGTASLATMGFVLLGLLRRRARQTA